MNKTAKNKLTAFLFFFGVFVSFCILYIKIVPIVIYNMDDWSFLAYSGRTILPEWGTWNPSRVLPEMIMPFVTSISVHLLLPLLGSFALSVETGMSLFVSAAVTIYAYEFYRLIIKKHDLPQALGLLMTFLFLVLHFLIFRTKSSGNDYLLTGYYDTTTFFFYLVPALLNASLVFYFMRENYFWSRKEKNISVRAFLFLLIYLCIFSNLYQSIILAGYVFVDALIHLLGKEFRGKTKFQDYSLHLTVLVLWLVSLIFESQGGRADSIGIKDLTELFDRLKASLKTLISRLNDINSWFVILLACSACIFVFFIIFRALKKNRQNSKSQPEKNTNPDWWNLILFALILVYEWLLCAVSKTSAAKRGDVLICCFLFLFLFICDQISCIYRYNKKLFICLPLITLLLFSQTITPERTWMIRTNNRIDAALARKITDHIITECINADQNREDSAEIHIPKYKTKDNWPLSSNGERAIPGVLYHYNITAKKITIKFITDTDRNLEYGIPTPE